MQQLHQQQRRAAAAVSKAFQDVQQMQSLQRAATTKLLFNCPRVAIELARPVAKLFSFREDQINTVRQCSTALSLLMAAVMDVLIVPRMADVQRCVEQSH